MKKTPQGKTSLINGPPTVGDPKDQEALGDPKSTVSGTPVTRQVRNQEVLNYLQHIVVRLAAMGKRVQEVEQDHNG